MPRLSTSPWLGSVSTRSEKQVKSAVKQCFSSVETRVVVYRRPSLRNKLGSPACFIERQRGVSIRMPSLHQSVFRPFLPKAAGQN